MAPRRPTADQPHSLTGPNFDAPGRHWVFGYGSLVDVEGLSRFLAGHALALGAHRYGALSGFAAAWTVAMDNSVTHRGYKYYVDAETGTRPDLVAFANIERRSDVRVNGLLFEVDDTALQVLDARERNYARTDVTAHFDGPVAGTVWTYLGLADAGERFRQGLARKSLVIDAGYASGIARAFARASLAYSGAPPPGIPLRRLMRVDT